MEENAVNHVKCPTCSGEFTGLRQLRCQHIICQKCFMKHTKCIDQKKYVICPYDICEERTVHGETRTLPPYDISQTCSLHTERTKAMESDIYDTAKVMGLEMRAYDHNDINGHVTELADGGCDLIQNTVANAEIDKDVDLSSIDISSTTAPTATRVDAQKPGGGKDNVPTAGNTYDEDYEDYSDEDSDAMRLMQRLSDIAKNCKAIRGFTPNATGEAIMVDTTCGDKEMVEEFLQANFTQDYEAKRLVIVRQKSAGHFLVGIGMKIANGGCPVVHNLLGQPSESLRSARYFATVTCLAEDETANGQIYLLTSNHVVNQAGQQSQGTTGPNGRSYAGRFFSSYHNMLEEVGDAYYGVFGPVQFRRISYNVDIAALRLTVSMQGKMNSDACACRMQELVNIYRGRDTDLQDKLVRKNGAATGLTCGRITHPFYHLKYESAEDFGRGFLVVSQQPDQPFAKQGDSGALVWSTEGQPLGIVSYQNDTYQLGEKTVSATFVVRLDRCLTALRRAGYVQSVLCCKTHGSPVPVIKAEAGPGRLVQPEAEPQPQH